MYFMYMVPVQIQCILYCMVWYGMVWYRTLPLLCTQKINSGISRQYFPRLTLFPTCCMQAGRERGSLVATTDLSWLEEKGSVARSGALLQQRLQKLRDKRD